MDKIFYIMGKSASGKDKIYKTLLEDEKIKKHLRPLVIYTTRPIRANETDGVQYHFVDAAYIAEKEAQGKVIERRDYNTVCGIWSYCTIDDGSLSGNDKKSSILGIGTLQSFVKMREYYGAERIVPIYIDVEDGARLQRALKREQKQLEPNYKEMCRRYLADCDDFSEENIAAAGINRFFDNTGSLSKCISEVEKYIISMI